MKRLLLLKNEGVIVFPDCRAKCCSTVLDQTSARPSRASSEQDLLPCPSKEPCSAYILAGGAQYVACSPSDRPLCSNLYFSCLSPFILAIVLHMVLIACLGKVVTKASAEWSLCRGKALWSRQGGDVLPHTLLKSLLPFTVVIPFLVQQP